MANNPNVNKVIYGNQTVMDITDTTATEGDVANGAVFYKANGARSVGTATPSDPEWGDITGTLSDQTDLQAALDEKTTEEVTENLIRDTVGWTGKNLLNITLANLKSINTDGTWNDNVYTKNGITYTVLVNDDDYIISITTNGTASARGWMYLQKNVNHGNENVQFYDEHVVGDYIFSDGVNTDIVSDKFVYYNKDSKDTYLLIADGVTVTNIVWQPMLRRADISDPTYEPYHESVKQTLRDYEVIEGKNLLHISNSVVSQTINGVTFTVNRNENGEVTDIDVNGTASSEATLWIHPFDNTQSCPYNGCLLSGCLNGDNTKYLLRVTDITTQSSSCLSGDTVINVTDTGEWGACIIVRNGVTVNHVKFYPMIRKPTETDPTFEPYYIPLKDSKFDRSEQRVLGAKNWFNVNEFRTAESSATPTISDDGKTIEVSITTAGTYKMAVFQMSVEKNVDYLFTSDVTVTNGHALVGIADTSGTDIKTQTPTNNKIAITFNSGNRSAIRVKLLCTTSTSEVGDVTYTNNMLRLASDPDDTYVPYAMTNKELTDQVVNKVITLTKAQYDALSTAEKNDPSKVYYVTDYDAPKTYVELDDSSITLDKVWSGQKIKNYADNAYTLPTASSSTLGGVKIRGSQGIDGLRMDSSGNLHLATSIYDREIVTLSTPVTIESGKSVSVQEHITDTTFLSKLKKGSIIGCEVADTETFYLIYCISRCDLLNGTDLYFAITMFNLRSVSATVDKFYIIYTYFGYMS